jgi:hypothetical protein
VKDDNATINDRIEVFQEVLDCMGQFPVSIPLDTGGSGGRTTQANIAKISFERRLREGNMTHCHIIDLAATHVLATSDVVDLRAYLIKLAAAAMNAIEHIDGL